MRILPTSKAPRRELDIQKIAVFILQNKDCTSGQIQQHVTDIQATARSSYVNYINAAVEWGWVTKFGDQRDARYQATAEFRHAYSLSNGHQSKLPKIGYNPDFLDSYRPNIDLLLTSQQIERLHEINAQGSYDMRSEEMKPSARRFMADISFHSSVIEGANLKYADTIAFLEDGIEMDNLSVTDAVILRNHYATIRWMIDGINFPPKPGDVGVSEYDIRCLHAQLSDGLLKDRRLQGRLRFEGVEINGSRYIPLSNPSAIEGQFHKILDKANQIHDPWEKSFFLLVHLPYLQPFQDCNKRTARLACNIPLLSGGALPIAWTDTDGGDFSREIISIYEHNSYFGLAEIYCQAYERSTERFDLRFKNRQPERIEVTYAKEISQAIRAAILDGNSDIIPASVAPESKSAFAIVTHEILDAIKSNPMVAGPYRIPQSEVEKWISSDDDQGSESDTALDENMSPK